MNSRNRSQQRPIQRNERQMESFGRNDPFSQMHQVMKSFGGFGFDNDDFFGGGFGGRRNDLFKDMMEFSGAHKNMHQGGKQGSYVCQTYVSSSTMGNDGKVKKEAYYQNSAGQHDKGQTISQTQQAYKNNQGINRLAQQRMLNDKGRKIVKQKRGDQVELTNHYYNMDEQDVGHFDNNWKKTDHNMKFLENHKKHLQIGNNPKNQYQPIGYGGRNKINNGYKPSHHESRQIERNSRQNSSSRGSQLSSKNSNKLDYDIRKY